jgi:hypothetical protein
LPWDAFPEEELVSGHPISLSLAAAISAISSGLRDKLEGSLAPFVA